MIQVDRLDKEAEFNKRNMNYVKSLTSKHRQILWSNWYFSCIFSYGVFTWNFTAL